MCLDLCSHLFARSMMQDREQAWGSWLIPVPRFLREVRVVSADPAPFVASHFIVHGPLLDVTHTAVP